ncbi:hypothetical protein A4G99_05455 [Haladaptatus sp. R4]|uniref:DUF7522 family protein n=1 Tax=Haladaptatus sp. R4 TaxID=1679489 RepID=UPI0007B4EB5A|nr:hypothetical protein [Haladaptatus sp. R4]KZN25860.1 hypothetical protein A4G99_05455 [Haladaptatus sp. R4]
MSHTTTESRELVTYLQTHVGDLLRSVLYYDADSCELLYIRDDVADAYDEQERADVRRDMRLEAIEKSHQEDLYNHGSLNCTIRCFDDAIEMHFTHGELCGTAVALDGEAFAVQNTFVGACLDIMNEE